MVNLSRTITFRQHSNGATQVPMFIGNTGNVGIGTTAPGSYKLNVNGETKTLGLYSAGTTNLGTNGGSNVSDKTILAGYGVLAGNGVRYGNYGSLIFRSSSGYTAGARSFLITNGYDANKFAIIQSNAHTTVPDIDGAGGGANNGDPRFVIDNSGNIGINTASPSNALSVGGVITSGNFTATGVGGTPADDNTAEVGPGYINLARDDTAAARQITFGKNGAVHSYLETTSAALEIGASSGLRTRILGNGNTVFQAGSDRLFSIGSGTYQQGKIRQYVYQATVANGATVDLFGNTSAHTDIHYYMTLEAFHSGRSYKTSNGSIGGYGWYATTVGTGISPTSATVATGRQKLRWTNSSGFNAQVYISALIFGNNSVDVYNGAISEVV